MHELKTPLTKGKLTLAMMEKNGQALYLDTLFNRMDMLINQFAHIEKLQSSQLHREHRNVYTLLEEAIENLYLEQAQRDLIKIDNVTETSIDVDSELFVSALSNLLDNALKYSTSCNIVVTIKEGRLCISNPAEAMPKPIEAYLKPFTTEHHSDGGLGLGLYIVESIASAHGFALEYRYEEGIHIFCIRFK
jgi:two-component system OmpR family sensor kinase